MTPKSNIVVLGGGESGVGAAILAQQQGHPVFVSDFGQITAAYQKELDKHGIAYEQGQHSVARILEANLVIKSPGIPDTVPLIQQIEAQGIPVIDEIEWASCHTNSPVIAITGSNGKTTTTKLIHHLLVTGGIDAGIGGNIGYSWARQVALAPKPYYVLELSSFQLDRIQDFCPAIVVLLNITPDHLDRYKNEMASYAAAKLRLVKNNTSPQTIIYNQENEWINKGIETRENKHKEDQLLGVSPEERGQETWMLRVPHSDYEQAKSELALQGRHNWFNMQCAVLAASQVGITPTAIAEGLRTFENDPHRLETILTLNEVTYINDSKATNVDAVYWALDAMTAPVVWIAGGVDKGNKYTALLDLVREKVRAIVCLGRDNEKIKNALEGVHDIVVETISMEEAIKVASLYAEAGDVVLLSPACASFDLFENYSARGNRFREILEQQHKILTEGISVTLNLNWKQKPVDHQSDNA
ncbi:MAG: UDP-N-acetylmuramoyl-L-alanine--D-glutamate ligase [Aureispira sp.]